jgi:CHAT domain-containing protein
LAAGPDLAEAENEVRALAGVHQDPVVLAPPDSTVAGVTAVLGQAGLAHFACHGQIRADNPMFSGLWLSDGALTVQELELRDIAPHRVVLAACEAAADATYPGGETLGFVSALLARGTAGIVASTIVVPDTSASDLMVGLHQRARDSSLSVALHEARARLNQEDPLEFVNWCGFTAYGAA